MEGRGREHQVEALSRQRPVFEGADTHFDRAKSGQVAARHGRQRIAELDSDHLAATLGERQRGLARAAPDFKHARAWPELSEGDEVVEQRAGVAGACASVALGLGIEGGAQVVGCGHGGAAQDPLGAARGASASDFVGVLPVI